MIGRIVDLSFGMNRKQRLTLEMDSDCRELFDQMHGEEQRTVERKTYVNSPSVNG